MRPVPINFFRTSGGSRCCAVSVHRCGPAPCARRQHWKPAWLACVSSASCESSPCARRLHSARRVSTDFLKKKNNSTSPAPVTSWFGASRLMKRGRRVFEAGREKTGGTNRSFDPGCVTLKWTSVRVVLSLPPDQLQACSLMSRCQSLPSVTRMPLFSCR